MSHFTYANRVDQSLDIAGSLAYPSAGQYLPIGDEPSGLGAVISGQEGLAAVVTVGAGTVVTGLTGMTAASVGNFLTLDGYGAFLGGTFLIIEYVDATSVKLSATGLSNQSDIQWRERKSYSLEDDLNYGRSNVQLIKGTTEWYNPIPTYTRPDALNVNVPANLSNIASKTTDARGFILSRAKRGQTIAAGDGYITLTGSFKHSDAADKTGVPTLDVGPYVGNRGACYVMITNNASDNEFESLLDGYTIFGLTRMGSSVSPGSVEVAFYSVAHGHDINTAQPYTWEVGQVANVDLAYGYFERLDKISDAALRQQLSSGSNGYLVTDSDLRRDIDNLQVLIGVNDEATNIYSKLTSTTDYFPFSDLTNTTTTTVIEALQVLNDQIGNRTYTTFLTDGYTITQSLEELSLYVQGSRWTRIIERASINIPAGTPHLIPGGLSYTLDPSDNGANLMVFIRGILRSPGNLSGGNDYLEADTTHITPYFKINIKDHVNYLIKG